MTSEADRDDCFAWLKQQIDRTFVASDGPLTVLDVLAFFFINPSPKFFFLFFLQEDAWSVLFTQKLCHTNIQNISPAAFVLFESLFIHINERERRIQLVRSHASDASDDADDQVVLQHPTNRHFEVISYADLTGLSYLWDITLKIVVRCSKLHLFYLFITKHFARVFRTPKLLSSVAVSSLRSYTSCLRA